MNKSLQKAESLVGYNNAKRSFQFNSLNPQETVKFNFIPAQSVLSLGELKIMLYKN
jgi:hypothetical protein